MQFQMCVWVVAWLTKRLKSTFLEFFFLRTPWDGLLHSKTFRKTLILAFDVIVQPPKHTFEIALFPRFSSLCHHHPISRQIRKLLLWTTPPPSSFITWAAPINDEWMAKITLEKWDHSTSSQMTSYWKKSQNETENEIVLLLLQTSH